VDYISLLKSQLGIELENPNITTEDTQDIAKVILEHLNRFALTIKDLETSSIREFELELEFEG